MKKPWSNPFDMKVTFIINSFPCHFKKFIRINKIKLIDLFGNVVILGMLL